MNCGIYKITNKITKQGYIGRSIHIEKRWKEHLNGKGNKPLHLDILKYGKENFIFEILELCEKDNLIVREEYWIKYYDTFNNGYNLNSGGDNIEQSTKKTKKQIFCYDLNGNFLKNYESLAEAERQTKISNSNISRAAKTFGRTKNFQWRYDFKEQIEPYKRKCSYQKNKPNVSKPVLQFDLNNNFIKQYPSAAEASRQTGVYSTSICENCNKKRKSAGGYIWRFLNNGNS